MGSNNEYVYLRGLEADLLGDDGTSTVDVTVSLSNGDPRLSSLTNTRSNSITSSSAKELTHL
jgi:hypothetical protein